MDSVEPTVEGQEREESSGPDYQDLYLRTLADFDNYRKRIERERSEIGAAGRRDILVELLDVVDNFERAEASLPGTSDECRAVAAGYVAIYRQLQRLLDANGVARFESVGEPFDPSRHEAVTLVASDSVPADHVVDEMRCGYNWNGKLLRPARVVVSTGSNAGE